MGGGEEIVKMSAVSGDGAVGGGGDDFMPFERQLRKAISQRHNSIVYAKIRGE